MDFLLLLMFNIFATSLCSATAVIIPETGCKGQCWVPASEHEGHNVQIYSGNKAAGLYVIGAIIHLDLIVYAKMEPVGVKLCGYFASSYFVLYKCTGDGVFILNKNFEKIEGETFKVDKEASHNRIKSYEEHIKNNKCKGNFLKFDDSMPVLVQNEAVGTILNSTAKAVVATLFKKGTRNVIVAYTQNTGLKEIDEDEYMKDTWKVLALCATLYPQ